MKNPQIHLLLQRNTGMDLSADTVDGAVRQRMKQRGADDYRSYVADVVRDRAELDALIDLVVVPETWFFRDVDAFTAACTFVAERMAKGVERVRILSIPCASGEEPYSMAIALREAGIPAERFAIVGVDVSPQVMQKAQRAIYTRNAFRSTDIGFREKHFTKHADGYALREDIRQCVQFHCANLLTLDTPVYEQTFDIVFCRNLLIYFDEPTQAAAIRKLDSFMKDDGLLFAGYAETAAYCRHGFALAPYAMAFALHKKRSKPVPATNPAAPVKARRKPAAPTLPPAPMPAVPRTQAAVPAKPLEPTALLEQARRLADRGTAAEARAAFRAYLEQAPDSAEAYFMLGLVGEQLNDDRDAEECLRRAIYLDPDHYDALCHLALLAERHGNDAAAVGFRQRAARVYRRQSGERS